MVLRHLAAEINRSMFRAWAAFQLVLGGVLVGLAWRLGAAARILAMADLVKAAALAGLQVLLLRRP